MAYEQIKEVHHQEKLYIHLRCISRVMPSEKKKNPVPKGCIIDDSMHVIF